MAKLGEKYETMVVFSLKSGDEQVEALKTKFTDLISANAEMVGVNEWGKRRLAYPINYENDGYYVLYMFDSKPDFPEELERVLNITEGILRFLTVLRIDKPVSAAPEPTPPEVETTQSDLPATPEDAPEEVSEEPEEVAQVSEEDDVTEEE